MRVGDYYQRVHNHIEQRISEKKYSELVEEECTRDQYKQNAYVRYVHYKFEKFALFAIRFVYCWYTIREHGRVFRNDDCKICHVFWLLRDVFSFVFFYVLFRKGVDIPLFNVK